MRIILIRHGMTEGNAERRYIGRTDQPLSPKGIEQATALRDSGKISADAVYSSPHARCLQTAQIVLPGQKIEIRSDLRECDFGKFEGKRFDELENNAAYKRWLDTECRGDIPGGDSVFEFQKRCANAVADILRKTKASETAAIFTHGGAIMGIMERFAVPLKQYYEYYIKNCGYYICECGTNESGDIFTVIEADIC